MNFFMAKFKIKNFEHQTQIIELTERLLYLDKEDNAVKQYIQIRPAADAELPAILRDTIFGGAPRCLWQNIA